MGGDDAVTERRVWCQTPASRARLIAYVRALAGSGRRHGFGAVAHPPRAACHEAARGVMGQDSASGRQVRRADHRPKLIRSARDTSPTWVT